MTRLCSATSILLFYVYTNAATDRLYIVCIVSNWQRVLPHLQWNVLRNRQNIWRKKTLFEHSVYPCSFLFKQFLKIFSICNPLLSYVKYMRNFDKAKFRKSLSKVIVIFYSVKDILLIQPYKYGCYYKIVNGLLQTACLFVFLIAIYCRL